MATLLLFALQIIKCFMTTFWQKCQRIESLKKCAWRTLPGLRNKDDLIIVSKITCKFANSCKYLRPKFSKQINLNY